MEFVLVVIVNPGGMPAGRDSETGTVPDVVETLLSEWLLLFGLLLVPLLVWLLLLLLVRFGELVDPPLLAAISSFNRLVMWDFMCFRRWSLR